ncbi:hypothetical protein B0H19DRAFT_541792 [Mycena capillaripes]|nr:hypothetical protein B0H19DRAFT_541792 [Mycena capillaripes]
MRFLSLVATLATAAVVSAQNQTVMVNVGAEMNSPGGIFQFMPNTFMASNNSIVTFIFSGIPGNHSVTQSTFASPCEPMAGGFDSGWVEILKNTTGGAPLPQWNLTITNDQTPIWFFCKQLLPGPHCFQGMVGGINVQAGANSFSSFQAKAVAATGTPVAQTQGGLGGVGASATALPSVPTDVATLFPIASATAPTAGGSTGASGASSSPSAPPSGAVAISLNFNLFIVVGAMFAGGMMVL